MKLLPRQQVSINIHPPSWICDLGFAILEPIYMVRLCRIRQAYDRPTTWLRAIYTRTTFSPYDIKKMLAILLSRKILYADNKTALLLHSKGKSIFLFLPPKMLASLRPPFWSKKTSPFSPTQWKFVTKYVSFYQFWLRLKTCFKILRHFLWRTRQL